LLTTPGKSVDYEFVARVVQEVCDRNNVKAMAFDQAHIKDFIQACENVGFPVWIWEPDRAVWQWLKLITHSQGHRGMDSKRALWMPRSLGQYEHAILTGNIIIDDNPITKWCAGNAAIQPDAHGNRYFVKERSRGPIDGMVSGAMGIGAAQSPFDDIDLDIMAMVA
jgi:phage terminase large subunit-like protein